MWIVLSSTSPLSAAPATWPMPGRRVDRHRVEGADVDHQAGRRRQPGVAVAGAAPDRRHAVLDGPLGCTSRRRPRRGTGRSRPAWSTSSGCWPPALIRRSWRLAASARCPASAGGGRRRRRRAPSRAEPARPSSGRARRGRRLPSWRDVDDDGSTARRRATGARAGRRGPRTGTQQLAAVHLAHGRTSTISIIPRSSWLTMWQ